MLFNSYTFLAFFTCVYVAAWSVRRHVRAQNFLLLLASYVFYAAWDYRFLGLILLSTVVDFVAAKRIAASDRPTARRRWLVTSLAVNLGMLGIFKYLNFFVESFSELSAFVGLPISIPIASIVLPVGISFYTFQTLSYTIDVYRNRIRPCEQPLAFALYVAFFPQLVAGPIERATHFLPQVCRPRRIRASDLAIGTQFVLLGYFYKVVLADSVAPLVDQYYRSPSHYGGSIAWIANLGFAVQIYGDFAGYSLIARGVSRWMGFRLISNFRQPFLATGPRDFWTRWHRSLSTWLRRYLYFELGGSRFGFANTCRNLMITMLLGGLWHGASWNFVLWGGFHGLLLIAAHALRHRFAGRASGDRSDQRQAGLSGIVMRAAMTCGTFLLMLIGWTLFRCQTLVEIGTTLSSMFSFSLADPRWFAFLQPIGAAFVVMLTLDLWRERKHSELMLLRAPTLVRWTLYVMFAFSVAAVGFRPTTFLYFQF